MLSQELAFLQPAAGSSEGPLPLEALPEAARAFCEANELEVKIVELQGGLMLDVTPRKPSGFLGTVPAVGEDEVASLAQMELLASCFPGRRFEGFFRSDESMLRFHQKLSGERGYDVIGLPSHMRDMDRQHEVNIWYVI